MAKKEKSVLRTLVEKIGHENTSIVEDGLSAAEFTGYIDTGSYALNALISGSIYGGIPNNKTIAFAGESATGKTFFMLGIAKHFLDAHTDGLVIYYDTEAAVTKSMMKDRGIDTNRVGIVNLPTVQDFESHVLKLIGEYEKTDKTPMMIILDSLGALTSIKSLTDATERELAGKYVKDMTLQQAIRSAFRNVRLQMAKAGVPMLVTQHTYASMSPYEAKQQISGGGGLKYAADDIILLSGKTKEKDEDKNVIGNEIRASTFKSRLSRESQEVWVKISYDHGLDKHWGLFDIAVQGGLFEKEGNRYKLPSGDLLYEKEISPKVLDQYLEPIENIAKKQFSYNIVLDEVEKVEA